MTEISETKPAVANTGLCSENLNQRAAPSSVESALAFLILN